LRFVISQGAGNFGFKAHAATFSPMDSSGYLEAVFAGFGKSLQVPLNTLPHLLLCSATMAVIAITPMTRKITRKTTAITRTGIHHLGVHSVAEPTISSVIAVTGGCEVQTIETELGVPALSSPSARIWLM
jgi:hypothetical protein